MNDLQVFEFDGRLRVRVTDQNGSPWFVAKDVCEALEIKNASDAISRLDQDERGTIGISDSVNGHSLLILSESGLYALILRCQVCDRIDARARAQVEAWRAEGVPA